MKKNITKKQIEELIRKGETEEAIKYLSKYGEAKNDTFHDQCILISSSYHEWKNREINGLGNPPTELPRINHSILKLLDGQSLKPPYIENNKNQLIFFVILLVLIVAFGIYMNNKEPIKYNYYFSNTLPNDTIEKEISIRLIDSTKKYEEEEPPQLKFYIAGKVNSKNQQPFYAGYTHKNNSEEQWTEEWITWHYTENMGEISFSNNDSTNWTVSFFHELKSLNDGEEFWFGLFKNKDDIKRVDPNGIKKEPFAEIYFKVNASPIK